jgi:hypothetical protein
MADYYPLVAKAVAGLEKNTGEGRRALYERARSALVAQLRGMNDPPLTEAEITRERLALEEAIRKVEAEAARRGRSDPPRPEPPKPADVPRDLDAPAKPARDAGAAPPAPPPAERPGTQPRNRSGGERRSVTDEGLKGFRDVIAEAEALGDATAQGAKTAREAFAATPPSGPAFDRLEPRVEPEGLRTPVRPPRLPEQARGAEPRVAEPRVAEPRVAEPRVGEPRVAEPRAAEPRIAEPRVTPPRIPEPRVTEPDSPSWDAPAPPERPIETRSSTQRQTPLRQPSADDIDELPKRSRVGLVAAILSVLIILGLGGLAFYKRDWIASVVNAVRGPAKQTQKDSEPSRPKIPDRVGQPSSGQDTAQSSNAQGTGPVAAVAQRVVLYEEDPADPQGKRYVGSAIWRTETITPGPGAAPDLAVRADLEIPERRITMTFSLRRNSDQALPASHTIEVTFNLPADFPFGGIANVPGILMKQAEQTRGAPLAGLAVKVTSGFFLVGLSAVEADMQRNLQLLKERSWFDVPIVYNNGRRAILALEKGTPGDRAFEEAFRAWGQ